MTDKEDLEALKYVRIGWQDQERTCDVLAKAIHSKFEGEDLPQYWQWRSLESFLSKHAETPIMWARTASYHLLLINGFHVLRVWTDSPKSCIVDLNDVLANELSNTSLSAGIIEVPGKSKVKAKPMLRRVRIKTLDEAAIIITAVKRIYGLGSP